MFYSLEIDENIPAEIVEHDLWVKHGDKVKGFEGANNALGTLVLKFNNAKDLEKTIDNQSSWLKVIVS